MWLLLQAVAALGELPRMQAKVITGRFGPRKKLDDGGEMNRGSCTRAGTEARDDDRATVVDDCVQRQQLLS